MVVFLGIVAVVIIAGMAWNNHMINTELMDAEDDYILLNDKFVELEAENKRLSELLSSVEVDEFEPYAMTNDLELEQETLRRRKESNLAREII